MCLTGAVVISPVSFRAQLHLKRPCALFLVCHLVVVKDWRKRPRPIWHVALDQVTLLALMKVTWEAEEEEVGSHSYKGQGGFFILAIVSAEVDKT